MILQGPMGHIILSRSGAGGRVSRKALNYGLKKKAGAQVGNGKSGENIPVWTLLYKSKWKINVFWTRMVGCRNSRGKNDNIMMN